MSRNSFLTKKKIILYYKNVNQLLQIRDSRCKILTSKKLECVYPRITESKKRRKRRATRSNIIIYLDGFSYTFPSSVLYVDDPVDDPIFAVFNDNTTYNFDPNDEESIKLVVRYSDLSAELYM